MMERAAHEIGAVSSTGHTHYSVLGGTLESELAFPDLPAAAAASSNWRVSIGKGEPSLEPMAPLGSRTLGQERYRLWQGEAVFRLEYSHAGIFEIRDGGRDVVWYPLPAADPELARAIILGPVLALALEMSGELCLHGSAVAAGGAAVAFLGGKYHGKSTLATALTAAGATLVSDDIVAIDPNAGTTRPGVASVRLWEDSAAALRLSDLCERVTPGIKTTASGFGDTLPDHTRLPVRAIYLLTPEPADADPRACWRTPLGGPAAAVGLAHQTKLPVDLVGRGRAGMQLGLAAAVAARVPVMRLHVVRDLSRLDATVAQLLEWHDEEAVKQSIPVT